MTKDIRPLGATDGKASYWVKESGWLNGSAGHLRLVVIDEAGHVEATPTCADWDDAAMTRAEAIEAHLAGAIKQADRQLERRRREAPEPTPKPEPMSPATQRFYSDDEPAIDLSDWRPGGYGLGWG